MGLGKGAVTARAMSNMVSSGLWSMGDGERAAADAVGIYLSMIAGIGMPAVRRNGALLCGAGRPVPLVK